MLRAAVYISIVLNEIIETEIEKFSVINNERVRSEEDWVKSIKDGNICLEDFKCPPSNQLKASKRMVTNITEKNLKSSHVVHSNVVDMLEEGATANDGVTDEDGFILILSSGKWGNRQKCSRKTME